MKSKFLLLLSFGSFALNTIAQTSPALTLIKGTSSRDKVLSMTLFDVKDGEKIEYATSRLNDEKQFAFALPANSKGYYYLTDQRKKDFIKIYLKPGDKITLNINEDNYEVAETTPENKIIKQWTDFSEPVTKMTVFPRKDTATYKSFFPTLNAFLPKVAGFKKSINTPNKLFNEQFKKLIDLEIEHAVLKFLYTPNTIHPTKEDYPAYLATIYEAQKYKNEAILDYGFGTDLLGLYNTFLYTRVLAPDPKSKKTILEQTAAYGSDAVKGIYVSQQLARFRTLEEFNKEVDPVKKYLVGDSMKSRYFRMLKKLSSYKKGDVAYNFAYPDVTGKTVSMKDLKGKVVVVDVWATWCGPCKGEIPHLKKLEAEMKDKNVEFVSISVDEAKDKQKWLHYIDTAKLGGLQLLATGWSDITKFYDITGIPRFMVFDQEGKIVTADAPRPSTPQLKEMLLSTLNSGKEQL